MEADGSNKVHWFLPDGRHTELWQRAAGDTMKARTWFSWSKNGFGHDYVSRRVHTSYETGGEMTSQEDVEVDLFLNPIKRTVTEGGESREYHTEYLHAVRPEYINAYIRNRVTHSWMRWTEGGVQRTRNLKLTGYDGWTYNGQAWGQTYNCLQIFVPLPGSPTMYEAQPVPDNCLRGVAMWSQSTAGVTSTSSYYPTGVRRAVTSSSSGTTVFTVDYRTNYSYPSVTTQGDRNTTIS